MQTTLGILRVTLRYSYVHGNQIYFQRAVPKDLLDRYPAKMVKVNLRTSDVRVAARKIAELSRELEAEWALLRASPDASPKSIRSQAEEMLRTWGLSADRTKNSDDAADLFRDHLEAKRERYAAGDEDLYRENPADQYLTPVEIRAAQLLAGTVKQSLSDALELYLKVHPKRDEEKFTTYTRRAFATLTDALGDKPIKDLSREDAHAYVAHQQAKGNKSGTIRRRLNVVNAVIETYFREKDIDRKNPFASVPIPAEGKDTKERQPFTETELHALFDACKAADDDVRHLIAILGDTGARLAEIAGLALDDLKLDTEVPHVIIQEHPWRTLKNTASARAVPLLGHALWAAKRVKERAMRGQRFAFPRYTSSDGTKATHASNTIAKWIRSLGIEHTAHELRHTMADRLRDVQCPEDIREAIGGWTTKGVAAQYGKGYGLKVMADWLGKVTI